MNKRQKKKFKKKFGFKKWSNADDVISITLKISLLPQWIERVSHRSKYEKVLWRWYTDIDRGGNSNE